MATIVSLPSSSSTPPPPPLKNLSSSSSYTSSLLPPPSLTCPITQDLFQNPVLAVDGHTYEKMSLRRWLRNRERFTSPVTNEIIDVSPETMSMLENRAVKTLCDEHRDKMDGMVAGLCAVAFVREEWTRGENDGTAEFHRLMPLFLSGGATGSGRCEDGNGILFNLIAAGTVHPPMLRKVLDATSGRAALAGGVVSSTLNEKVYDTDGVEMDPRETYSCAVLCRSNGYQDLGGWAREWRELADVIENKVETMREAEDRRVEAQRGENEFSNIPPPMGGVEAGEEEELTKRKQLQVIVRILTVFVLVFFFVA
ncbi:hypothetical protein TeGR_g4097 [Tetraparma gracilis]|uniref:U-box domain-containing protein n=1 Tax=Tetraparma gracilis TaxID=2962635 RepID=A0ABQ6N334_9STRA|nr:hypothetical protein TeGR_g4097 [Tetraparma gracilis]